MTAFGLVEMPGGAADDLLQARERRIAAPNGSRRRRDAGGESLARKIKPADRRVLVEVAQDIGELQRAAEMMGKASPAFCPSRTSTDSRPTALATRSQ